MRLDEIRERVMHMKRPVLFTAWDSSELWVLPGEVFAVQATNSPQRKAHLYCYSGDFLLQDTVGEVFEKLGWEIDDEAKESV